MTKDNVFPAHIRGEEIQTVAEHCKNTAEYASNALAKIGLANTGYLSGLVHDLGKCKDEFRSYIIASASGESVRKGSVNHTFAGVKFLLEQVIGSDSDDFSPITASLIAYAAGAHHGQFDLVGEDGKNGFEHRIKDNSISFEESWKNYTETVENRINIEKIFHLSTQEIRTVCYKIVQMLSSVGDEDQKQQECDFCLALLARLILSAVIDADRRDTAEFMLDMDFPKFENIKDIWGSSLQSVEAQLNKFDNHTEIQKARSTFSNQCKKAATGERGIYRLNIPTGGGKTLSALRFSLVHAGFHEMDRIVMTSPLLSILDQNARIVREFVDNDSIILEHHSNIVSDEDGDRPSERDLLIDTWNAPIVITTMVQLLNTMFSGKTSSIRRFHSLSNSILLIDEVQTIPIKTLSMFNLCISFLSTICSSTIVLCSATQPCFEEIHHGTRGRIHDIIPYDSQLWETFKRTSLLPKRCNFNQLAEIVQKVLKDNDSLLVICNKKAEAEKLYRELSLVYQKCFHLSASMCMQHRKDTLCQIEESLKNVTGTHATEDKVLCISTQVIEAGVDISFASVIRLAAGMDNAIQAAGRCNRNGESKEPQPVYLVYCQDENLSFLPEIQREKDATNELLSSYENNPEKYGFDLSSDEAIKAYYHALYRRLPEGYQDYCTDGGLSLFDLLSENERFLPDNYQNPYPMNQAFKTAGDLFEVFEGHSYDIVVPYKDGEDLIAQINGEKALYNLQYRRSLVQKLKPYSISLFQWQKAQLETQNGLYTVCDGTVLALDKRFYDNNIGLITHPDTSSFLEV